MFKGRGKLSLPHRARKKEEKKKGRGKKMDGSPV